MKSQTFGVSHTKHQSAWANDNDYDPSTPVLHSEFPHTLSLGCDTIAGMMCGLCVPCLTYPHTLCCIPCLRLLPCNNTIVTCAEEAVNNYRANRENGKPQDNPNTAFPQDGEYTWTQPNSGYSSVTYTESLKDRIWMKKKDCNYSDRLEREKKEKLTHTEEINITTQLDGMKTTLKPEKMWNKPFSNSTDKDYFQEHHQIGEDDIIFREKGEDDEEDYLQNVNFPAVTP